MEAQHFRAHSRHRLLRSARRDAVSSEFIDDFGESSEEKWVEPAAGVDPARN